MGHERRNYWIIKLYKTYPTENGVISLYNLCDEGRFISVPTSVNIDRQTMSFYVGLFHKLYIYLYILPECYYMGHIESTILML